MKRTTGPRYSKEEFARRGDAIYEEQIRHKVERGNKGKFIALDIETGDYEMDASDYAACKRLRERIPDSQTWLLRIGYRAAHSFCGTSSSEIRDDRRSTKSRSKNVPERSRTNGKVTKGRGDH